jgi:hypothetical protein
MNVIARLGITAAAMLVAAVVVAIAAAVVDLYLSGHGLGSISDEIISQPSWGVHLSMADLVLLVLAAAAGALTWWLLPRR